MYLYLFFSIHKPQYLYYSIFLLPILYKFYGIYVHLGMVHLGITIMIVFPREIWYYSSVGAKAPNT